MYPALRRLVARGLLTVEEAVSSGGREQRLYHATESGRAVHLDWLRRPVDPATVVHDLGLHLMRFVMMEHLVTREEVLRFPQDLTGALTAFTTELEQYSAVADLSDRHPLLALNHGLAVHRASLRWAGHAIAALSAAPTPSS
jgi:hypothetical protein